MSSRFEKFSERARRMLSLAQEEAQRLNHNYIGTEHLLLGLTLQTDSVAAKVLSNYSVEPDKVRAAVESVIGKGTQPISRELGLTPRAKKVIELAVDEARRHRHHYIGTEHLLIGIMREDEGVAAGILKSFGVDLEKVRTETLRILAQSPQQARWRDERRAVVLASQEMAAMGLVTGPSGNVSMRLPPEGGRELLAITPTGKDYGALKDEDIVVVDFDVETVEGERAPSSEALLHVGIYRARPDVGAVVHTHSVFSSVAAVAGLEIPPLIDEVTVTVGGAIKVSEYAFPGTQELADKVCAALGERKAALIRNHGAVGVGRDLREALDICALVERVAQIFVYASLLGKVNALPPDIVEKELAIYRMRQGGRP
jgi:L-ribulose-5-phosphate 4-epimerase